MNVDDGWEPCWPGENRFDDFRIELIMMERGFLQAEEHPDDFAYHISGAMHSVEIAIDRGYLIDAELRDRILSTVVRLHARARLQLPLIERQVLSAGVRALIGQILFLAQNHDERRVWSKRDLSDVRSWARVLRNEMHNQSLLSGREWRRQRYREGKASIEEFVDWTRRDFERMARNELHNEELLLELGSRTPPDFGLRLSA